MNFINSFLGSSNPNPTLKMDGIVDSSRRQFLAPNKDGPTSAASAATDAAYLNSQHLGGTANSTELMSCKSNKKQTGTSSSSFYHGGRLLDPNFINHLAEYSDTDEGIDNEWDGFEGTDEDIGSGFTPENVFGPTEEDASASATAFALNLNKPLAAEADHYSTSSTKPHYKYQAYSQPHSASASYSAPTKKAAPQKRKSFTLTKEEPTMYIPADMMTIEAYMGPPAGICPSPPSNTTNKRYQRQSSPGNMPEDDTSDSEDDDDDDDGYDDMENPPSSNIGDHVDPFSKLVESNARTESTRKYLEETRRIYSSIPDFHRFQTSTNSKSNPNLNSSFNESFSSTKSFNTSFSSTTSFNSSINSTTSINSTPSTSASPNSTEHQSRMSNLLTAMERTEQSRSMLRRRQESVTSASAVSASGITSLVIGRACGSRKSRGASPSRSYQRLF